MSSICENIKCGKEHDGSFGRGRYCSRSCANTRIRTEESKLKTSITTKNSSKHKIANELRWKKYWEKNPPIQRITSCVICGNDIYFRNKYQSKKTCSYECKCYYLSLKRQEIIKRDGFNLKRELFSYKNFSIECDSILEKAAIIYLTDIVKVSKIERFHNLLSFYRDGFRKTFNPDFWIEFEDGRKGIVEVKMRYYQKHQYDYNATIPFKKESLERFCKERNYEFLWLDFDYDNRLKEIYRKLLSTGGSMVTAVVL